MLFALALDPLIVKLQDCRNWKVYRYITRSKNKKSDQKQLGRYLSVSVVLGLFIVSITLGSYLIAPQISTQIQNFAKEIPQTVKGLERIPLIGEKIGSKENQEKISDAIKELPDRLSSRNSPLGTIFKSIANGAIIRRT